jgi:hypothetical protein
VDLRRIIGSGITASAIVHLSFLVLIIFFSEVRPFGAVTAEPIAVDIVTPDEAKSVPSPETKSEDSNPFDAPGTAENSGKAADSSATSAASSSPAAEPSSPPQQAQADPSSPPPSNIAPKAAEPIPSPPQPSPLATPQAESVPLQPQPQQPAPPASQQAYVPAQPDLTIKYHVMLGLPQDKPGDGFDAVASQKADVASGPIAEFRRHLKSCSTLPKSVSPSDKVSIKLRVFMTPEGRLAAPPMLVEASASAKGPALMQSAMSALQACQPYSMLPTDKYREWKVLDLNFTPDDFTGAS